MTFWLGIKVDIKITFIIPGNTVIYFCLEESCSCFNETTDNQFLEHCPIEYGLDLYYGH